MTRENRCRTLAIAALAFAFTLAPRPLPGQGRLDPPPQVGTDSATVVVGPRYEAGALRRWLLGSDWRGLWTTPTTLPVLALGDIDGGLVPERAGGGNQSITLHLDGSDGRGWIFRSLDKYPAERLDVGGVVDWILQDQVSALHPGGQLALPVLLSALDILHVEPRLYVMADDPALGEFRGQFAGLVGALELQPNEGPGDTPGFAGSSLITDADRMLERLEEEPGHFVDERELLRARFLDFIIGDTDRGTDQWRFARFPDTTRPGRTLWRPIPRDRDWTFISGDGAVLPLFRKVYPKHVVFEEEIPGITALTFSSHVVDRSFLTRLTRQDFEREAELVRTRLTDAVIEDAVERLPSRYPRGHRGRLAALLATRRDDLPRAAMEFYDWLALAVDVRGTDAADLAEIVRHEDGSATVTLSLRDGQDATADARANAPVDAATQGGGRDGAEPYYRRRFLPEETREVRIFLHGDDDLAVVRGASRDIVIRVIGGGSDDVLADSSGAGGVYLYDARGDNEFVRARGTSVDTRPWDPPPVPEGFRFGSDWAPDYGRDLDWAPFFDYGDYSGVVVGFGPSFERYGFRRLPHHWAVHAAPLLALGPGKPGVRAGLDYRFENSLHALDVEARWSEFDAIRWFAPGNESPLVASGLSLVPLDRIEVRPGLLLRFGAWRRGGGGTAERLRMEDDPPATFRTTLRLGPVFRRTRPEPVSGSPLALDPDQPAGATRELGVEAGLDLSLLPRTAVPARGVRFELRGELHPGLDDARRFATADATVRAYVPLVGQSHLALRIGGTRAWGDFPAWHAPAIGGRASLRGFRFMRFNGDAAAYGGAEIRVPLADWSVVTHGRLGALAFGDAGRVWLDGHSPGGWHTGFGGGLWYAGLAHTLSVYLASGEREQIYLSFGMPF